MNSMLRFGNKRRNLAIYAALAVLIIAGLLLPPISLLERVGITCSGTTLDANTPAISTSDGLTIALSDTARSLTVKLNSVDQTKYDTGAAGDELVSARDAQPVQLMLRSPIYQIDPCSQGPLSTSIAIKLPENAQPNQTYDLYKWDGKQWSWLGAYLDPASNTVSAQVEVLPKQIALFETASVAPAVSAQVKPGQILPKGATDVLNEAYITGWALADDGSILATAGDLPNTGKAKLIPVVQALEAAPVRSFLASEDATKAHLAALNELAGRSSFAGVAIDYRGLPTDERAAFTKFIQQLAADLHAQNKLLVVVLPAPSIDANGAPDTAGYDWAAIGTAADIVQADFGQDPANYLSGKAGYALIDWAPTQISRYKFQPIFSLASIATAKDGTTAEVPFAEAIKPLGQFSLTTPITLAPGAPVTLTLANPTQVSDFWYDAATQTYRFKYMDKGTTHDVVVKTSRSLANQLNLLLPRHMRGAVITGIAGDVEPASLTQALTGYRQQSVPANLPSPLDLQWKITLASGQVITTARPITDTTFVWTAPDQAGEFTVTALVGSQPHGEAKLQVSPALSETAGLTSTSATGVTTTVSAAALCLSSAFVADVTIPDNSTLKNSETFTKTWRIRNDGTCNWPDDTVLVFVNGTKMSAPDGVKVGQVVSGTEKEISIQLTAPDQYGNYTGLWQLKSGQANFGTAMSAVIQAGEPPAGNVLAGQIVPVSVGGFELGGQINGSPFGPMKRAGMTWIKTQSHGGDESGAIAMAHNNGFKILISVLGDKGQATNPAYQDGYAREVAKMAAAGADAIEVWNEPNIDREWPAGQISGGNYTALLARAYKAIKAANSNTLVISAAPAPTGFWGAAGCADSGCNDNAFLAQMAAAGAANYMDCVGTHYNEGVVGPDQTSGIPRGNSGYYTRYFWGMVNTYFNAFGGARKICFTELGYLTPEGYSSLQSTAPNFAWAENTTVAEQAQWLARAAAISAASGKVRLMTIFNVDFDYYGDDPQAGYAIIRKGGSCPACDALGAVLGSR